jgi:hypothetical protein
VICAHKTIDLSGRIYGGHLKLLTLLIYNMPRKFLIQLNGTALAFDELPG